MPTITRKIEVKLHLTHDPDTDKSNRRIWYAINDNLYKAANRIVSHKFFNDEYEHRLQIQSPEFKDIEKQLRNSKRDNLPEDRIALLEARRNELYVKFADQKKAFLRGGRTEGANPEQNSTYRVISDEFLCDIPSDVLTCLNQNISSTYDHYKRDIAKGNCAIPNYKKGIPVPFSIRHQKDLNIRRREDGNIYVRFPKGLEWDLYFGRDRSNNREIVERILSGVYKACNSSIQTKNDKTFLLLTVEIPKQDNSLDSSRVVGVDLGLNMPLYAATDDNPYGGLAIGSRQQFLNVRERMNARKRELQRSLSSSTNGGRGRLKKLQALELFKEKERNWVHLQNHIFSKAVVNYALQQKAGVIQMEDLSGFGRDKEDNIEAGFKYVIRYWSYYELQSMIEYKANAAGIKVRRINPYHTSQTCSFCGHYEKGQRVDQATFICKNPNCAEGKGRKKSDGTFQGINADWNAARNIAKSTEIVSKTKK